MDLNEVRQRAQERSIKRAPKSTPGQRRYLEILFIDLGFDSRLKRNDFLTGEVGREIHFLEDLTFQEAHRLIEQMKEQKERTRTETWREREEDDGYDG